MTALSPTSPWHPRRLARTAGFVLAAVAVAGAAFLAVLHFQPPVAPAVPAAPLPPSALVVGPDPQLHNGLGPVGRPAFQNFDGGKLVSDFTADDLTPRKDGTVDVRQPRARFYTKDGGYLLVTGNTGVVSFGPAGGDKASLMSPATKMPSTGNLYHVHIGMYPSPAAAEPTLTMDTDNVRFDNDTLRLYTEKIPPTGADPEVAADRVPVVVRGADYDMDGTGLTLRLSVNPATHDRQLHLLEIAHGKRLTIRHPAALGSHDTPAPRTTAAPAATPPGPALASADPAAVPLALPPAVPPPQAYRAVFNDQVRIAQGDPSAAGRPDQTIGLGDVLTIDFVPKKSPDAKPTTASAARPVTQPAPAAATTVAAMPPATRPAKLGEQPVTVYWTGKLRVTPWEPASTMMPLDAGQAAVRLAGRPATLTYGGATAIAAVATYRTADDAVRLEPSPACPVVHLSQPQKGMALDAQAVAYDPATSVATIVGPATLRVTEAARRTTMTATWADRGLLHVVNAGADPAGVDHVDLAGDVHADDPKFSLVSRRLLLDIDTSTPTTRPGGKSETQLRRLTAVGAVVCRLLRPGLPDEGIEGDRLVVGMAPGPDGTMAPRDVLADGRQVHAFDAQQALFADHLEAVLAPKPGDRPVSPPLRGGSATDNSRRQTPAKRGANGTTHPATGERAAVAVESMYATGHVKAVLKSGATATADTMRETTGRDGRQFVELFGTHGATVSDPKHGTLVGSVLHVNGLLDAADSGVVVVDGPGTMHTFGKPTTKPTTTATGKPSTKPAGSIGGRPIDVSWVDGLSFDSAANTADVVGHVLVKSVDANGTVSTAVGDRAHLEFEDDPKAKGGTAKPDKPKDDADENLGSRTLRSLTLVGHMVAESELDEGGKVVQFGRLKGDRLVYTAVDDVARVPGPGTLFVEKHKPAKPTPGKDDGKAGTMAIGWQGGLAYAHLTGLIHIVGDVRVGFQQDNAKNGGGPMQMRSDELTIEMRKATGADAGKPQVSDLLATGAVHLTTATLDVHCHTADFKPDAGLLVATGSDAEPGRAVDTSGRGVGSAGGEFGELEFDTNQNTVRHVSDVNGSFRR